jgi:hypothetical protein
MQRKFYLLSVFIFTLFIMIIMGSIVYAHGPSAGSRGGNFMGNGGYGMMGSHGMMGGNGMMGGGSIDRYGRDNWNGPEQNIKDYNDRVLSSRGEIEKLRNQINAKRKELATLYRSKNADNTIIDKKIDELSNLERYLDEKISAYESRR